MLYYLHYIALIGRKASDMTPRRMRSSYIDSYSVVLFTLFKVNAVFKPVKLFTPVPPNVTGTIPTIFSASTLFANCA